VHIRLVNLDNLQEHHDTAEVLDAKVNEIAGLIRQARHLIVFTGAGISTSAKIPDFRGPEGVWTRQAQGRPSPASIPLSAAVPTLTHMALVGLAERGIVKHVVSQNVDGLHRRSGLRAALLSELHGNCYLETCWQCKKEFLRDYEVHGGAGGEECAECRQHVPHFCHCTPCVRQRMPLT